jgi:hypothetical protein
VKAFPLRQETCGKDCAASLRSMRAAVVFLEEMKRDPDAVVGIEAAKREAAEERNMRRKIAEQASRNKEVESLIRSVRAKPALSLEWGGWKRPEGGRKPSIATAFFSDSHFDEVVKPEQVDGLNAYNRKIATARLREFFSNTVSLARDYVSGLKYEALCMPWGGDTFSGDIHEELAQTNEATILESILYWRDHMIEGLRLLADEFPRVLCPVVVGNHPRMSRKPRAKDRPQTNFDWLFAHLVADRVKDQKWGKRVEWVISDSADQQFSLYSTTFNLTHGDQFNGGAGIAAALSPLLLGSHRKSKRSLQAKRPYDWLICGHWHNMIPGVYQIICNGTIKGYDEYAFQKNFAYEPPQQTFWVTDPKYGVTIRAPIHCKSEDEDWGAVPKVVWGDKAA